MMKKQEHINPRVWARIGTTSGGCNIYRSILGHYAVERSHLRLDSPTDEEKNEILVGELGPLESRPVSEKDEGDQS